MATVEDKSHLTFLPKPLPPKVKTIQRYVKMLLDIWDIQYRLREKQRKDNQVLIFSPHSWA